jgi:hypothetical protein
MSLICDAPRKPALLRTPTVRAGSSAVLRTAFLPTLFLGGGAVGQLDVWSVGWLVGWLLGGLVGWLEVVREGDD